MAALSADDVETSAELSEELNLSFPLLADPELKVIDAWNLRHDDNDFAVPAAFVIDTNGHIVYRMISESMIERAPTEVLLKILDDME